MYIYIYIYIYIYNIYILYIYIYYIYIIYTQIDKQIDRQIDRQTYMYIDISFQGCSFLVYCYIVDPGSYLENKDQHETKNSKKDIFKEKEALYYGQFQKRKLHFHDILRRAVPENGCTFFLDYFLSCYIVVNVFVRPGVFFQLLQLENLLIKFSSPNFHLNF